MPKLNVEKDEPRATTGPGFLPEPWEAAGIAPGRGLSWAVGLTPPDVSLSLMPLPSVETMEG